MTITMLPVPLWLDKASEDAFRAGWEVVRNPKSINIGPKGQSRKRISFPLAKPPTEEQVRVQLDRAGLYAALKKLEKDVDDVTTSATSEPLAKEKPKNLTCPECTKDGFGSPAGLASHRRTVHGVPGTSKTTAERNAAKAAAQETLVPAARKPLVPSEPAEAASPAPSPWFLPAGAAEASPEFAEAIEALVHVVTKESQYGLAPLQEKIRQQDVQITELQEFKDKVQAEVSNFHQSPLQTITNIINHGGEGFGTPTA
ncbi:hypothetical protein [Streptomyces sp. NPDC088727]|uniref:hypothetical protein n=1 Tax=Streptomyces sp. NPDC088727 TaxID=3365875 RepID=UPI00382C399D